MIIAFQIILLIIIFITFLGIVSEKKDKGFRDCLVTVCISSIAAFVVSVLL